MTSRRTDIASKPSGTKSPQMLNKKSKTDEGKYSVLTSTMEARSKTFVIPLNGCRMVKPDPFEMRQLYLDSLAVTEVAEDWIGEISTWPWSSIRDDSLSGYQILPMTDKTFEVWVKEPIEPMDWAGAIIAPRENNYSWTLYFGFTDQRGEKHGYKLPDHMHPWPMTDIFATSVMECVERIHRSYQEPSQPLLMALEEARRTKTIALGLQQQDALHARLNADSAIQRSQREAFSHGTVGEIASGVSILRQTGST